MNEKLHLPAGWPSSLRIYLNGIEHNAIGRSHQNQKYQETKIMQSKKTALGRALRRGLSGLAGMRPL